jgi:hypothetical protein
MRVLKELARRPVKLSKLDETKLSQVHAMNCLKEVFKSSLLGKKSESHIADCLQIAADSLNSEVWAIRNCGLLLLRSLIDALFGTNESKAVTEAGWDGRSLKLSYEKYPALPELLLKLLDTNPSTSEHVTRPKISSVESMFPALDIIRRAGPPSTNRDELYRCVSAHLGSKVWHVRELAARTICTLLLHDDWVASVAELLETSTESTNRLHGVLMALKFVLERRLSLSANSATGKPRFNAKLVVTNSIKDGLDQLVSLLKSSKVVTLFDCSCPEILAMYFEVNNVIARILLAARDNQHVPPLVCITDVLFPHDAYEDYRHLMRTHPSLIPSVGGPECLVNTALACKAVAVRSVLTSALRNDTSGLHNVVTYASTLNDDVALAAIEAIPDAWHLAAPVEALFGLVSTYMGAIGTTQSPEVRSAAIMNLADVIDRLYCRSGSRDGNGIQNGGIPSLIVPTSLDLNEKLRAEINGLGALLQDGLKTPSLSNSQIRISGSLLVCECVSQKHSSRALDTCKPRMEAWGKLLAEAGVADMVRSSERKSCTC